MEEKYDDTPSPLSTLHSPTSLPPSFPSSSPSFFLFKVIYILFLSSLLLPQLIYISVVYKLRSTGNQNKVITVLCILFLFLCSITGYLRHHTQSSTDRQTDRVVTEEGLCTLTGPFAVYAVLLCQIKSC